MFLSRHLPLIAALCLSSCLGWAQVSEKERLSGFAQHHKNLDRFEEARVKGERAYLEEEEQWENLKNRSLEEYKKNKKQIVMDEDGPEAKADALAKKGYDENREKERRAYEQEKAKQQLIVRENLQLPSEAQELGLDELRPRYEYRKRALYGASPKYGKMPSSSGGRSSFGGGAISPGGSSFPPPPTFDDFGGDGGYVPAPNMPDDYGDVAPPPPPPPFGDDFGGGDFPPPPPPPPPFGEEGGDF